jgi:hypothetical protein
MDVVRVGAEQQSVFPRSSSSHIHDSRGDCAEMVRHANERMWQSARLRVILHVLLMGTLSFEGNFADAVFHAIKTVDLDFHSGQWASVSLLSRDLISQMLFTIWCG